VLRQINTTAEKLFLQYVCIYFRWANEVTGLGFCKVTPGTLTPTVNVDDKARALISLTNDDEVVELAMHGQSFLSMKLTHIRLFKGNCI